MSVFNFSGSLGLIMRGAVMWFSKAGIGLEKGDESYLRWCIWN